MTKGSLKWIPLLVILIFCTHFTAYAGVENVTIAAVSQDAKAVFQEIATSCGLNIVVDDSITSRITVNLTEVPYDQAIETVAKIAGANVTFDAGVYVVQNSRITYPSTSQSEQTSTQVFDLSKVNYDNAVTVIRAIAPKMHIEEFPEMKVVLVRGAYSEMSQVRSTIDQYLREAANQSTYTEDKIMSIVRVVYADVSETASAVQGQFTSVRVQTSRQSGMIVLFGPEREVEQVKMAIKELDRAPAILHFDIEVVEVNSQDGSHIGIDWTNSQGQYGTFSVGFTESNPILSGSNPVNQIDFRPWTRASLNIVANIRLLQENGSATIIARPSVTVIENKTAKINTTDRYTITTGSSTYPQYVDAGVTLEISGKVDTNGDIIVTLTPKVSGVVGFSKEGNPITSNREVTTTVILKPGETLVIGGLMRTEEIVTQSGIPILSKIPVLGYLFGSTKTSTRTTEVVIMVTPQVSGSQIIAY